MKQISLALFAAIIMVSAPALAQQLSPTLPKGSVFDVKVPEKSSVQEASVPAHETHPMLRITPDKSELVRLDRDAVSVIVGNPEHLSVLLDTPRVLVLIPRVPGATHFTVLDRQGDVIMQRHAIVAAPKQEYIRVRRSCINAADGATCNNTSVYFCPDMCHEVAVTQAGTDEAGTTALPEETPAGPTPTDEGEAAPTP